MKRRLVSRLVSTQDICLFCTFRPVFDATVRPRRLHHVVRNYQSSAIAYAPANAAAARKEEDDEDDWSMLRQNANLASSFPAQRSKPVSSSLRESSTRSNTKAAPDRHVGKDGQPAREGGQTFRNNFNAFSRGARSEHLRRPQENVADRDRSRQAYDSIGRNQRPDGQPRRFEGMGQSRAQRNNDPDFSQSKPMVRRYVPSHDQKDAAEMVTRSTNRFENRHDRGQRMDRQPQRVEETPQQQRSSQGSSPSFRRVSGPDREYTPAGRFSNRRDQPLQQKYASEASRDVRNEELPAETGETAIGVTSSTVEESDGFHHRRGARREIKKSRSSRFEEEIEEAETAFVSTPARAASTPSQIVRKSIRTNGFDFDQAEADDVLYGDRRRKRKGKNQRAPEATQSRPTIKVTEFMSVGQLARALDVQLEQFIEKLEEEGFEGARYDHILDAQTSSMLVDLYGFEPVVAVEQAATDLVARPLPEDVSTLPPRPPIVTIMGHVDHGKTTILDYLRKSSVVATEHGGITQHIGAFSVTMPGTNRQITFLDTPGHAAFLEMRRRGANVTDIVVLVVAADDSVKPQTIEAIKHAMEAKVQIIVAINKVDKEDANVERVKQDLTRHEIVVEDYGGDIQAIAVSGKTGQGMEELEEAIITLADVHDYRAEHDGLAEGTILESKVTAAGRVATVLVRRGTLRTGDFIVAGTTWARVRTLHDDNGALVYEALPGTPVQVDGWRGEDPTAGLEVLQAENEDQAKNAIDWRIEQRENMRASADMVAINEARSGEADARAKVLAWEAEQAWANKSHSRRPKDNAGWVEPEAGSGPKQVHFVIKADVAGSVEAVVAAVSAVGNNEIVANVVHSGTGQVTESDIRMLATTGEVGYAVSFNQTVDGTMYRLAEAAGLQILDHNIIYKVTDVVKEKLAEQLPPVITQKVLGEAEVGQIFEVTIKKTKVKIAGCKVTNGTISRANKVRVSRNGTVVYTGTVQSLKNVKKDVTEMRKGTECGMGFEEWDEFREGDQVQCFEEHEERRTLY